MISHDILPSLIPLMSENTFSSKQFEQFTRLTAYLLNKLVETRCQQYGIPTISLSDSSAFVEPLSEASEESNSSISTRYTNTAMNLGSHDRFSRSPNTAIRPGIEIHSSSLATYSPDSSKSTSLQADAQALAASDIWREDSFAVSSVLSQPKRFSVTSASGGTEQTSTGLKGFLSSSAQQTQDLPRFNIAPTFQSTSTFPMSPPSHASTFVQPKQFPTSNLVDPFDFGAPIPGAGSAHGVLRVGGRGPDSFRNQPMQNNGEKEDPFAFLNS